MAYTHFSGAHTLIELTDHIKYFNIPLMIYYKYLLVFNIKSDDAALHGQTMFGHLVYISMQAQIKQLKLNVRHFLSV